MELFQNPMIVELGLLLHRIQMNIIYDLFKDKRYLGISSGTNNRS